MSADFEFQHRLAFHPANADAILREIPAAPGIFALRGDSGEPYLTRAADLRRRIRRILAPPEALDAEGRPILSKRLNLRDRVRTIDWTRTGSDFESSIALYCATRSAFGDTEARRRMRLYPPYFVRVTMQHQHPRVYTTNRLSPRALDESFGPFPSRTAAERYADAVLDLFKLRRCHEDLQVHPEHPGCAYGEMKKCLEPCKTGAPGICSPADYAAEATAVRAFFATRGDSMLTTIATQREAASQAMDFEAAATLHKQWEKVRSTALLADELVRRVPDLRAVILQESAPRVGTNANTDTEAREEAAVFLLDRGLITGPEPLSTLGVRAVREQTAVGSSLFAQPLMLAAVPLAEAASTASATPSPASPSTAILDIADPAIASTTIPTPGATTLTPEDRARNTLAQLTTRAANSNPTLAETCDYLSLFRRWYYRPEKQRQGEVFLPNPDTTFPIRRILNGAARVVLGPPVQADAVNREALKAVKTKVIHEGREGVERTVPILPKRTRTRKAIVPGDVIG